MAGRPPRAQEPTVLQVFIFKEGRFYGTECFNQSQIIMGRSPDVDLQLDDDIISRSHATIEVSAEGTVIEDLASSNGTYVNGEPIERCFISARDEVSIGVFTLKVKLLARSKPKARFRDETRVVDRDQTEVAPAAGMREIAQEPFEEEEVLGTEPVNLPHLDQGREEVADRQEQETEVRAGFTGLADDLEPDEPEEELDFPATQRMEAPPREALQSKAKGVQAGDFESTQIEPSPDAEEKVVAGVIEPQDQSTRWLTPDPNDGPPLELASEPLPEPVRQPAPEPPRAVMPEPQAPAQPETVWPSDPEPEPARPSVELEPGPAGAGQDYDDYDEEDEDAEGQRDFVEPFSLLNNLIRENFAQPQVPTVPDAVMEVISYTSDKDLVSYDQIARGKKHKVGPDNFVMIKHNAKSSGRLLFNEDFSGGVITGGQTIALDDLKRAENQVGKRKGRPVYAYKLMQGDYANLIRPGGGSFVRFVNPPQLPKAKLKLRLDPLDLKIFGSSFLGMVLVLVGLGLLSGSQDAAADVDLDRFAKVDLKDIQMEKPEEEIEVPLDQLPEPEKKEEEKVEEKKEEKKEEKPKEKPKKKPKVRRSKKKAGGDGGSGGGAGMMAALGNLNQKKSSKNIVAAVTNLDAVRVPGGRSRYKVSGLVTKLPTSSVVTSRGKGVGVKGGIDLLRGGKGRGGRAGIGPGALGGGRTGKRGVGGVVFKAPKRKMKVRGTLSREAIAKVVRKHLKAIQYCYERNLMLNPKLSGKLIMEWTISTSGSVSVVKTKTNTMASPAVAMCVSANIKKWKFPKPKGGIVVVSYPFIFNSIGF